MEFDDTTDRPSLHAWELAPDEAVRVQSALRAQLVLEWDGRTVTTVGGVDVGLERKRARAAIVVLRFPDLSPVEGVTAEAPLVFPYIPGLSAVLCSINASGTSLPKSSSKVTLVFLSASTSTRLTSPSTIFPLN